MATFYNSFFRLFNRNRGQTGRKPNTGYEGLPATPEATQPRADDVQISACLYLFLGGERNLYEFSLNVNGKDVVISSLTLQIGDRTLRTNEYFEWPAGKTEVYVLEVTTMDGKTYTGNPEPIILKD